MKLLYLVHNLEDAAVLRRRRFLQDGGARVSLIGFRRRAASPASGDALAIGRTRDGRLLARIAATAWAVLRSAPWRGHLRSAEVVLARNLEMLLIAVLVRARLGLDTPIVYECLDIHRLMNARGPAGVLLRLLERRLLGSCALLIVSSAKFIDAHFNRYRPDLPRWVLLENKLLLSELGCGDGAGPARLSPGRLDLEQPDLEQPDAAIGPPWRIGWFGVIRCSRSLSMLAALARASDGAIEVEIRGRPARDVVPDFDSVVAATPGMSFAGPYDRATDLPRIYGRVHFNWTIDYYEDGLNSAWLLPNRLYEGTLFGAVPLALRQVETGRWLAARQCGLLLDAPAEQTLPALFASLTPFSYRQMRQRLARVDAASLIETPDTASSFVATLSRLPETARAAGGTR